MTQELHGEWVLPSAQSHGTTLVMIPGGGLTGSCFRATPDGRSGWADRFARRGFRVLVTDWPGTGRSEPVRSEHLDYALLVAQYSALMRGLGQEVAVLAHSMGAPIAWKLLERIDGNVRTVIGVAPAPPGNIQPALTGARVDAPADVTVRGVRLSIDLGRPTDAAAYIEHVGVAGASRLPAGDWNAFVTGFPPRVLLARINRGGTPSLDRGADLRGKRAIVLTGTADVSHSRADDAAIATFLASRGATVEHVWLGDCRIEGNGHLMMWEDNSLQIADLIADRLLEAA